MSSRSFNPEPTDAYPTAEEDVSVDTLRMSQSDLFAAMAAEGDWMRYESSPPPPPVDAASGVHEIPGRRNTLLPPPGEYRVVKIGQ